MTQAEDETVVFLRGALAQASIDPTADELAMLVLVHNAFAKNFEAITKADLSAVPLEWDLDPSRAPAT